MFLGSAVFTLVVSFLAWRRGGNRSAGWFLIAWSLLCIFQIVTAVRLLYTRADSAEGLVYYGLAPSMVAAAVLIALGVSDHVRQQSPRAHRDAERRARPDPLTGVLNRRSLIERLDAACVRARASNLPISVLFLDLDHFKQINDSYGHAAGDACLAGIIPPIQSELRQSDVIGRYGGEEFVVILYGADAAAAFPIAERICRRVSDIRIEGFGAAVQLTCSIGVAASDTLDVWGQHLIAHADTAVYAAKRSGRNQVQLASASRSNLKLPMQHPARRAPRHPAARCAWCAATGNSSASTHFGALKHRASSSSSSSWRTSSAGAVWVAAAPRLAAGCLIARVRVSAWSTADSWARSMSSSCAQGQRAQGTGARAPRRLRAGGAPAWLRAAAAADRTRPRGRARRLRAARLLPARRLHAAG